MGKATVYCEKCGAMIPEGDFTKGKAVHFQSKDYCAECKAEIAHLLPKEGGDGQSSRKSSSGLLPAVRRASGSHAAVPAAAAARDRLAPPSGVRSDRGGGAAAAGRREGTRHQTRPEGPSKNALYGLIAAGVVLLVVAGLWINSSLQAQAEADARQKREREAETAYQDARSQFERHPEDFPRTRELLGIAEHKAEGTSTAGAVRLLKEQVDRAEEAWQRRQERYTALANLVAHGKKTPNDIPALLADLKKLADDSKFMPEDFANKLVDGRKTLHETYVKDTIHQVNDQVRTIGNLDSVEPLKTRYTDLLKWDLDTTLQLLIQAQLKEVADKWNEVAATFYNNIEANVDRLLKARRFDEADSQVDSFPKKFADTKYYGELLTLKRRIEREREAAKAATQRPPNPNPNPGPGPGPGPNPDPHGTPPAGGDVGTVVPLVVDRTLSLWHPVGSGGQECPFKWDSPEEGILHGANPAEGKTGAIYRGNVKWEEYELEFEVKPIKGNFTVLVLLSDTGSAGVEMDAPSPRDSWHHFRVVVKRDDVLFYRPDREVPIRLRDSHQRSSHGAVGFGLEPGQEAAFRNIKVKVQRLTDK